MLFSRIAILTAFVFVTGLVVLGWNIDRAGIASPWSDPIARVRAQDESVYVNSAIHMSQGHDWLTPKLTGRVFPQKPPLLMWLAARAIRLFGLSLFAVRLPALILGAAGAAAVFAWIARARSVAEGILGAGILLLSPLWQAFSRLCYTDVLCSSFAALALAGVAFDPRLDNRRIRIACGVFGGASILSKNVAGVLPFAALLLYWLFVAGAKRPRPLRMGEVALWATLVAAPWHIYEAAVYPQWFWADYVRYELLGVGLHPRAHGAFDISIFNYVGRLVEIDPVLAVLAVLGFAGVLRFRRTIRQQPEALLSVCWASVTVAAICAFQTRNLPYVVLLLPSLCIVGALYVPRFLDRRAAIVGCVLAALFLVKATSGGEPWSLRWAAIPLDGARAMRAYYDLHRDAELISVQTDDQFYSSTIPLPHVRYCFLDPDGFLPRFAPSYAFLGVVLTTAQFAALPDLEPEFQRRLREWGQDSPAPIGTTILMRAPGDLAALVRARPDSDFYIPSAWADAAGNVEATHQLVRYSTARSFLLSRTVGLREQPIPQIPAHW